MTGGARRRFPFGLHSVVMVAPRRAVRRRACLRNAYEGGRYAVARATIHDFLGDAEPAGRQKKSWMVGMKPTMTVVWGICRMRTGRYRVEQDLNRTAVGQFPLPAGAIRRKIAA